MHFLLEDATHGHTWPRVRERWTGRRMRINGVLVREEQKGCQVKDTNARRKKQSEAVKCERAEERVLERVCVKGWRAREHTVQLFM